MNQCGHHQLLILYPDSHRICIVKKIIILVAGTLFLLGCSSDSPSTAAALDNPDDDTDKGLHAVAMEELAMAGLNKYMGDFEPAHGV